MYYKLLGCKVLEREIASVVCCCKNAIDVTMMRQQLHSTPQLLCKALQEEINAIDENRHRYSNDTTNQDYDAILLGYGLCSNAVSGLSSRRYPLVIPRAHDCVTLLMGDKDAYLDYYYKFPGTFYYWPGVVETDGINEEERLRRRYQMYLNRYKGNEKRAKKSMEIESQYMANYQGLTYISWDTLPFPEREKEAQATAAEKGWTFQRFSGNNSLLWQLMAGEWPSDRFLVVPPGHQVHPSYREDILCEIKH